jgi:hypothetical protein
MERLLRRQFANLGDGALHAGDRYRVGEHTHTPTHTHTHTNTHTHTLTRSRTLSNTHTHTGGTTSR